MGVYIIIKYIYDQTYKPWVDQICEEVLKDAQEYFLSPTSFVIRLIKVTNGQFPLNRPRGPIQSLRRNVCKSVCCVCQCFLNVLLLPFTKVESQIDQLQK